MAFKIIWSPEAIGDLHSLSGFIAQENPDAAERIGSEIILKSRHLEKHTDRTSGSREKEPAYP